jgi:hypothetical protein
MDPAAAQPAAAPIPSAANPQVDHSRPGTRTTSLAGAPQSASPADSRTQIVNEAPASPASSTGVPRVIDQRPPRHRPASPASSTSLPPRHRPTSPTSSTGVPASSTGVPARDRPASPRVINRELAFPTQARVEDSPSELRKAKSRQGSEGIDTTPRATPPRSPRMSSSLPDHLDSLSPKWPSEFTSCVQVVILKQVWAVSRNLRRNLEDGNE